MISPVLTIEAPARTNKVIPGKIPRTNTGILEAALTEATLRTEILTMVHPAVSRTDQDKINITVLKTDPAVQVIMTNTAPSLEVISTKIDLTPRIKDTTNPGLPPITKMVVTLELPVDPPDPELQEEPIDLKLQVDQNNTEIRADL